MTTTRDPWSDAHQAATQKVLEGDLVGVRRRIWLRRVLGLVLGIAVLLAALHLLDLVIDPFTGYLWSAPASVGHAGLALAVVGFVLILAGNVRASSRGVDRPFVGPDAFLSRADRAWLRTQVAERRPVPDERHAVVVAAARRMVGEATFPPSDLGLAVFFLGMIVANPVADVVVPFSVFTAVALVRGGRDLVRARGARRWLAQNT